MANYLKPQSPLQHKDGDYFYPLTTIDQIITENDTRLNAELISVDLSGAIENGNEMIITNADKLDGKTLDEIKDELRQEIYNEMINYSVVGGLTEPSNPTENMIWVNTDTEITKVVFKSIKPSNPVEGMVCIYTGASSNVSFDRIVINGIGIDEVYPISAIQYISGAWEDKTAKSYQGGVWVDWYGGELYKNGKEYEHITGGWMTSSYDGSAGGTVTKNENNITLSANSNGFAITVTGKSINLNGKSKLKVLFDSMNTVPQASRAVAVSLHSGATPTSNNRIAQELTQSNKTELTLDTSTQSGSYWVAVRCQYGATATFSEVVLE